MFWSMLCETHQMGEYRDYLKRAVLSGVVSDLFNWHMMRAFRKRC
jgi:hypothetical protein